MASRSITSREYFSGHDKRCRVRSEILEKVGETVEGDECTFRSMIDHTVVPETHSSKDDGQEGEAHELNGFASPTVDEQEAHPISWDETRDGENDVS